MRFFIVRHGETDWNSEGRFQGQKDIPLNERGIMQADAVSKRLAGHSFSAVVTSPLSRAKTTAEKIAERSFCGRFIVKEAFTEINHGEWEGRLSEEVAANYGSLLASWHSAPETVTMPGKFGESLKDVYDRVTAACDDIARKYTGDVLLASHDAVIKVLLCYWLNAPLSSFGRFQIPNCSITIVDIISSRQPRLCLLGDASHIALSFDRPEQMGL